jgi:aspartate aminotransferase
MVRQLNPAVVAARTERFGPLRHLAEDSEFINLAVAQHYRPPAEHIIAAVRDAVVPERFRYGATAGEPELLRAIASRLAERGIHVDPATEIRVVHGSGHAFLMTLMAFLCPGDEVITLEPSFPLNWYTCEVLGASVVGVPIGGPAGMPSVADRIAASVTPRTKAIIVHPVNNPTGDVLTRQAVEGIAEVARRRDLLVLSDEVFATFVFDGLQMTSIASLPGMHERTVTIGGVSKDYNLPGLRVGYLAGPVPIVEAIGHIQHNGPVGASVLGQVGALAALTGPQDAMIDLVAELSRIPGVACPPPDGGFFVFADLTRLGIDADQLYLALAREAKIGVAPGTWYGRSGSGHLRICYGAAPPEDVHEFVGRFEAYLARQAA